MKSSIGPLIAWHPMKDPCRDLSSGNPKILRERAEMLKQIGERRPAGEPLLAALLDCHSRIRRFSTLAIRLAEADAPPNEIAETAAAVHRYFTVALPLHAADEDLSIAPRLAVVAPELRELLHCLE